MAVALALFSALAWGVSDFLGGTISKRQGAWVTATAVQLGALVTTAVAAVALGGSPTVGDWAWGSASGLGVGVGTSFLFRGLATGRMGVVAPISAVGTAVVPVVAGFVVGERPHTPALIGIAVALPAIWLIAGSAHGGDETAQHSGVGDAILAGLGFGGAFACLDGVSESAGLLPLIAEQAVSLPPILLIAVLTGEAFWPRTRAAWTGVWIAPIGTVANACLLWALHAGMLTVVSVLVSLYPASTIALAALVLHERIHRTQWVGLGLAALSVGLISLP